MNENITKEQRAKLIADAPYNFVILDEDMDAISWECNGKPVIYGDIDEAVGDFISGTDSTIMSVEQYCKLKSLKVEDVMEY